MYNIDAYTRFPGAQPVSFQESHCDTLQMHQTLVCEKTDGVRYFLLETDAKLWFIVDRNYEIKQVYVYNSEYHMAQLSLHYPSDPNQIKVTSIYDGELV